jgi:hypothetical protein
LGFGKGAFIHSIFSSMEKVLALTLFPLNRAAAYRKLRRLYPLPGKSLPSKILYKMAWDRNPVLRVISDKFLVRRYIADRVGESHLVPLISVSSSSEQVAWENFPREFVVKVTHGSGGVIVVSESAPPNFFLPNTPQSWKRFEVHPDSFDPRVAELLLAHWQTLRYEWWSGRNPEFAYRGLRPRIIGEVLIKPHVGSGLLEVKAFVFNGAVEFFQLQLGGVGGGKKMLYLDKVGRRIPVNFIDGSGRWPTLQEDVSITWIKQVIDLSEALASGLDFIRVDFLISKKVYVGELTNYPTCGEFELEPKKYEEQFGSTWNPRY